MRMIFVILLGLGSPDLRAQLLHARPSACPDIDRWERPPRPVMWEYWLQHRPPASALLLQKPPDFSELLLNTSPPPVPDDDPFAENLTLYREGHFNLGLNGAKGFNLRKLPVTWIDWRRLLRLRNLFHLRDWVQPESNELRVQNVLGFSMYFYF